MIVSAATKALTQLFSAPFRSVLWKSLGLTILLLIGMWFALETLASALLLPFLGPWPWLSTAISWILGTGLVIGMGFLVAPVTSVFAGVFLDDVAEEVEQTHYPQDPPGRELPIMKSIGISARFLGLVLIGNLLALILLFFFGLGFFAFFIVNGYLLGREYFQFAGLRHIPMETLEKLRKRHSLTIFLAGLLIAAFLAVPFLNLLTPLFAGATMTHVFKRLAAKDPDFASDQGLRSAA